MTCDFDHPHPAHPCGRRIINGVTRCDHCGNLDGSPECEAAGCWQPMTEELLDGLYLEAWGLSKPCPCDFICQHPDACPRPEHAGGQSLTEKGGLDAKGNWEPHGRIPGEQDGRAIDGEGG